MGSHLTLPQTIFLVLAALGSVLLANCETFVAPLQKVPPPPVIASRVMPKPDLRLQAQSRRIAAHRNKAHASAKAIR